MNRFDRYLLGSAAVLVLSASSAMAAGIWLYESGTPDMGTAQAGQAAMARDASTAFSNPAGMTRLDRSQLMVGLVGLDIHADFRGETAFRDLDGSIDTTGNGENAGSFTPSSSFNLVYAATPDLRLGVSVGSYFGLAADYGQAFQGRYYAQKAEIMTMGINPSVGYKVNDWLSVGGGFTAMYGKLKEETAINNSPLGIRNSADGQLKINSDDIGWGYNFGIMLEPAKSTRIGVTYRSKIDLEFDDVASMSGVTGPIGSRIAARFNNTELDLGLTIPQAVMASVYQQLNDRLAIMGNVGWQDWSSFGNIEVDVSSPSTSGNSTLDAHFDDTWHGAIGAHYRIADPWLLMIGFAYDSSPVNKKYRSVLLPLDRQLRYATGIEYTWNKDITVGFDYTFIDAGSAKIDQNRGPLAGHITGEFEKDYISAFGLNVNWKF